jgi:hypothetical protein
MSPLHFAAGQHQTPSPRGSCAKRASTLPNESVDIFSGFSNTQTNVFAEICQLSDLRRNELSRCFAPVMYQRQPHAQLLKKSTGNCQRACGLGKHRLQTKELLFVRKCRHLNHVQVSHHSLVRILRCNARNPFFDRLNNLQRIREHWSNFGTRDKTNFVLASTPLAPVSMTLLPRNSDSCSNRKHRKDRLHPARPLCFCHAGRPVLDRQKAVFGRQWFHGARIVSRRAAA